VFLNKLIMDNYDNNLFSVMFLKILIGTIMNNYLHSTTYHKIMQKSNALLIGVFFVSFTSGFSQNYQSLEENLLKGDFMKIIEMQKTEKLSDDPVEKFIMAHAYLYTNQNNESFVLFNTLNDAQDLKNWLNYTKSLCSKYPENYISNYLFGDAYARLKRYELALNELNKSLELNPKFPLSLISRGIIRFKLGNIDHSIVDLLNACEQNPNLAEAWLELGVYWIKNEVSYAAIEALDKALSINNTLALAHLAKGIAYYGEGRFEDAFNENKTAVSLLPFLSSMVSVNNELLEFAFNEYYDNLIDLSKSPYSSGSFSSTDVLDIPGSDWPPVIIAREPFSFNGTSGSTNLFGNNIPPLKYYFPKKLQYSNPGRSPIIYDRVVDYFDYLAINTTIDLSISIAGSFAGAKSPAETRSPLEAAKLERNNFSRYHDAVRLRVKENGTYAFMRMKDNIHGHQLDIRNWELIPKNEAINRLNNRLSYTYQVAKSVDLSESKIFESMTGYKWHKHLGQANDLAKVLNLPKNTTITPSIGSSFLHEGVKVKTTVGDYLTGDFLKSTHKQPTSNSYRKPDKIVNFYITDFGIRQWNKDLKMLGDFKYSDNKMFPEICNQGQILLPMPYNFSKLSSIEKAQLQRTIYDGLKNRVESGIRSTNEFEIQIVQHINLKGYTNPGRQNSVKEYGAIVYDAIGKMHKYLESQKNYKTDFTFYGGSNGTVVFTENIDHWSSYMNRANLYDGRASEKGTIETIRTLSSENVRIYNTAGDLPAPDLIPFIDNSIGNHNVTKRLKKDFSDLTVIWLDPIDRIDITGKGHIGGMQEGSVFLAKEYNGKGYTKLGQMKSNELRDYPITSRQQAYYNEYNLSRSFRKNSGTWSDWIHTQQSSKIEYPIPSSPNIKLNRPEIPYRKKDEVVKDIDYHIVYTDPPKPTPSPNDYIGPKYKIGSGQVKPGGVSLNEIDLAWIDKGNWQFLIEFGLLY
jgi:Tetratricopeptide repeat